MAQTVLVPRLTPGSKERGALPKGTVRPLRSAKATCRAHPDGSVLAWKGHGTCSVKHKDWVIKPVHMSTVALERS